MPTELVRTSMLLFATVSEGYCHSPRRENVGRRSRRREGGKEGKREGGVGGGMDWIDGGMD